MNEPLNDIDMQNTHDTITRKNHCNIRLKNESKKNSKNNSNFNSPKKTKNNSNNNNYAQINSNTKENHLQNKYKKNIFYNTSVDAKSSSNNKKDFEVEVSEFNLNKEIDSINIINNEIDNLYEFQPKLSLNESRNSNEFHSKSKNSNNNIYDKIINQTNNKKNFEGFWNDSKNNKNYDDANNKFINDFTVSKFDLDPELTQKKIYCMPTNYEKECGIANMSYVDGNVNYSLGKNQNNYNNNKFDIAAI